MKNIDYLIKYEDIKSMSIPALAEFILEKRGLSVSELTISHLIFYKGEPIYSGNGVYVFKTKEEVIYIGNCVARNFVERIPAHFDLRAGGWFNSLLKAVIKKKYKETVSEATLQKASREAISTYELILINFSNEEFYLNGVKNKKAINRLEDLLRIILKPLNTFKHKKIPKAIDMVQTYLDM